MTTGREALHRIDAAIADARVALKEASRTATGDARALADLEARELRIAERLADVRLAHLQTEDADNAGGLGEVDRRAAELIERHDAHLAELEAARDAIVAEVADAEAERREAEARHDAAIAEHEEAAEKTAARLADEPAYQSAADALEAANAMARRAAQKLELAEADREAKGAPYEADPLFKYLHDRKFATKAYRAFPLVAMLDRWVAGIVDYRRHRLNYERLLELPVRLGEHAERLDARAGEAADALEKIERAALEADGVTALRDEVAAAQTRLEAADAAIDDAEARAHETDEALADAAEGEAGPFHEARGIVLERMRTMSVPDLRVLVAETPSQEDDRLVDELIVVRRERFEYEEQRASAARRLERQRLVLSDLEAVRRRFKSQRYDSPYSEFRGRDPIGALLGDFLRGSLSRDDLWRRIAKAHRTRQRDWGSDFGGDDWRGGFGLPDRWGGDWRGDWGGASRRRSRRVPRAPRPRVRFPSGGGFRTGGGFSGGGGFKTGGGF